MKHSRISKASGFSLVELMVAMVIGLIVIGAVLALVMSMINANNQTIRATRLTQELRATAAIVAADLRRAGSAGNPMNLPAASALVTPTTSAGCIRYSYSDPAGTVVQRAVSVSNGAVFLGTDTCGAGTQVSSTGVFVGTSTINGVVVNPSFVRAGRNITMVLPAHLASDTSVTRLYSETIFAPSLPGS